MKKIIHNLIPLILLITISLLLTVVFITASVKSKKYEKSQRVDWNNPKSYNKTKIEVLDNILVIYPPENKLDSYKKEMELEEYLKEKLDSFYEYIQDDENSKHDKDMGIIYTPFKEKLDNFSANGFECMDFGYKLNDGIVRFFLVRQGSIRLTYKLGNPADIFGTATSTDEEEYELRTILLKRLLRLIEEYEK